MSTIHVPDDYAELISLLPENLRREADELLGDAPIRLRDYARLAWPLIEPETHFIHSWHIDAICDHLEAVTRREIRNLVICIAPRSSKSFLTSVAWPTWAWTRQPNLKFLVASYSASLSILHAVLSRRILESQWYKSRWCKGWRLTTDQNIKAHYENTRRGYRISTSVGGTVTGTGGDFLVVDDPHALDEINSDTIRTATLNWYNQVWSTRLNDARQGCRVVIMQRGHAEDVAADCMEKGYESLVIPMLYEGSTRATSIGWVDPRTHEGELMVPERFGPKEVAETQNNLGTYGWAGQYQQRPAPESGGIFKTTWWNYYFRLPPRFDSIIMSWDLAFKDLDTSDFVVGQVWGRRGADKYLLDQVREKLSFTECVNALRMMTLKWPDAAAKLVEDKANGPAVIEVLKHEIPGMIPVTPQGSKIARAHAVSPDIEAGNVWLPHRDICPWIDTLIYECTIFPNGKHDDQVDALTQALFRLGPAGRQRLEIW